jgi:superfamily II DNA/RNA helicase
MLDRGKFVIFIKNLISSGLDIPSVKLVINYDIPCDATDYVHRGEFNSLMFY